MNILFLMLSIIIGVGAKVGLAFIPAIIARNKGYSFGGFWALGFFFFIVGLIVALCLTDKRQQCGQQYQTYQASYKQQYQAQNAQPQNVICPNCGTSSAADSMFCPRCGTRLK